MNNDKLIRSDITKDVIGAFFEVYNELGFGFLEYVYSQALDREIRALGRTVEREVLVPVMYKGEVLTTQRVDMIVDRKVVVEIKASEVLPPTARRQTFNYVRATSLEVALLLHFGPDAKFYRLVHTNRLGRSAKSEESAESASPDWVLAHQSRNSG